MPRLRHALTVVAAGFALSLLGAGTAAATPSGHCPPPPDSGCSSMDTDAGGCHGGMGAGINLGGLLDGLLGGLLGGGGACCADPH